MIIRNGHSQTAATAAGTRGASRSPFTAGPVALDLVAAATPGDRHRRPARGGHLPVLRTSSSSTASFTASQSDQAAEIRRPGRCNLGAGSRLRADRPTPHTGGRRLTGGQWALRSPSSASASTRSEGVCCGTERSRARSGSACGPGTAAWVVGWPAGAAVAVAAARRRHGPSGRYRVPATPEVRRIRRTARGELPDRRLGGPREPQSSAPPHRTGLEDAPTLDMREPTLAHPAARGGPASPGAIGPRPMEPRPDHGRPS